MWHVYNIGWFIVKICQNGPGSFFVMTNQSLIHKLSFFFVPHTNKENFQTLKKLFFG